MLALAGIDGFCGAHGLGRNVPAVGGRLAVVDSEIWLIVVLILGFSLELARFNVGLWPVESIFELIIFLPRTDPPPSIPLLLVAALSCESKSFPPVELSTAATLDGAEGGGEHGGELSCCEVLAFGFFSLNCLS